jgi:hypothetical protein
MVLFDLLGRRDQSNCQQILHEIKRHGNKPWDVIGISVDYPPSSRHPYSSSIGVLRDLDFMSLRPKYVLVRLSVSQG